MDYRFWLTIIIGLVLVVLIGGGCIIRVLMRPTRNDWDAPSPWDEMTGSSGMSEW